MYLLHVFVVVGLMDVDKILKRVTNRLLLSTASGFEVRKKVADLLESGNIAK